MNPVSTPLPDDLVGGLAVGGILGLGVGFFIACAIVFWVFQIIAYWKMFTKAGVPGWKSIIPFYNQYVMYKLTWKTSWFWITLIVAVVYGVFTSLNQNFPDVMLYAVLLLVFAVIILVLSIISYHKISKSYGHGAGYTVGMLFLWPIFVLILGYGKSRYIGPEGIAKS